MPPRKRAAAPEAVGPVTVEPTEEPTPVKATAPKAEKKPKKSTTVREGETIADVADRLGVTVEQVRKANGLQNDLIAHGTVLKGG